jgi:hypothetical protein
MTRASNAAAAALSIVLGSVLYVQGAGITAVAGAAPAEKAFTRRAWLDTYCVTCHNQRLKTASLVLDRDAVDAEHVGVGADIWEKVVRKLRSKAMPPPGARRPPNADYAAMTSDLESALDAAALVHPNPGRPSAHRLNRAEYANAVRDLLGLEIDARAYLPADDSGYGFDNVADVLSTSPGLLERYMLAAGKIGRLAVGDPTIRPAVASYRVQPLSAQNDRMSEDLPFGSRGGLAVRHHFPVDGEYVIKVRLQRTYTEIIRGMSEPSQLEVRIDRRLVKAFAVGAPAGGSPGQQREHARTGDEALEVRFAAKAGRALVGAAFVKRAEVPEGISLPQPPLASFEYAGNADTEAGVDTIEVIGPYNGARSVESPARRKIFICDPKRPSDEPACGRRILTALARRAYRRPVSSSEVQDLLSLFEQGRRQGGFDGGIEWAIERILVAPDFLFRIERDAAAATPGVAHRISDVELASRLSFFMWSSLPDDELLQLAERGKLKDPSVLDQQVQRMLRDPRASALVANFAGQWLYLRNLRGHAPDPNLFVEFDDNLRDAFQRETELFFESQLREDRSVIDLLRANYTFVNQRLARHYGIPGVYGSHFRRVVFTDDRRAGLLGQGSILTVTSYAHRTSPVVRGKWLLENLLGAPPPPPPPNIPALKENNEGGKPTSVRERLEQHRKSPVCASCHARMDPLGFGLENFDAIGRWRTTDEAGNPIDSSGTLPDGTTFTGPAAFRQALLARSDEFVSALTEKLLIYAIGRGLEGFDMPAVRAITRQAAPAEYRWSSLIAAIVKSVPFQMRTIPPADSMTGAQARTGRMP